MKKIKTTRYFIERLVPRSDLDVKIHKDKWMEKGGATILRQEELTEDDYGLILDALYERANEDDYEVYKTTLKGSEYAKSLRKVAKKFEKIFQDDNKIVGSRKFGKETWNNVKKIFGGK